MLGCLLLRLGCMLGSQTSCEGCQGCCSPQSSPPQELDLLTGDPKWLDVIERDLHRQFPFHEMFVSRGGHGYVELLCVQP